VEEPTFLISQIRVVGTIATHAKILITTLSCLFHVEVRFSSESVRPAAACSSTRGQRATSFPPKFHQSRG
jgi:hypothetical protein